MRSWPGGRFRGVRLIWRATTWGSSGPRLGEVSTPIPASRSWGSATGGAGRDRPWRRPNRRRAVLDRPHPHVHLDRSMSRPNDMSSTEAANRRRTPCTNRQQPIRNDIGRQGQRHITALPLVTRWPCLSPNGRGRRGDIATSAVALRGRLALGDQVLGDLGLSLQPGQPWLLVHAGHLLAGGPPPATAHSDRHSHSRPFLPGQVIRRLRCRIAPGYADRGIGRPVCWLTV
jgi:hypothetical protein